MKQVNKAESRADRGWGKLQPILTKELPIKKDRDKRFLWIFLSGAILLGVAAFVLYNKNQESLNHPMVEQKYEIKTEVSPAIIGTKINAQSNNNQITNSKSIKNEAPTNNSSLKSTTTISQNTSINTTASQSATTKKTSTIINKNSKAQEIQDKQHFAFNSNSNTTSPKAASKNLKTTQPLTSRTTNLLPLELASNIYPLALMAPSPEFKIETEPSLITPRRKTKSKLTNTINPRIGYAYALQSISLGLSNNLSWNKNNFSIGVQLGADYIPANYYRRSDAIFASQDEVRNADGGLTNGLPTGTDINENELDLILYDSLSTSDQKSFDTAFNSNNYNFSFFTGLSLTYRPIYNLTAKVSAGKEFYPFKSPPIASPTTSLITVEDKFSYNYLEIAVAYQPTQKIGLNLGYHFSENILELQSSSFNTSRIYAGLEYTF